jgi:hypothetical protein
MPIHALLMFGALMIGHHFPTSDLWNAPSASGVAPTLLATADEVIETARDSCTDRKRKRR